MSELLPPEVAAHLLRAHVSRLEAQAKRFLEQGVGVTTELGYISADLALIAHILADHIDASRQP